MRACRVGLVALLAFALVGCDGGAPATQSSSVHQAASSAGQGAQAAAEPSELSIPKINARSSLVALGLNADQSVRVPPVSQPMQAGWFSGGPTPGATGPAVILGHVNGNKQAGIFSRLRELAPGDEVTIARKDGSTVRFVVREVDQVAKDKFPTDQVYGDTAKPELRLITCGGSFDQQAHSYRDNVIVYADLAGQRQS